MEEYTARWRQICGGWVSGKSNLQNDGGNYSIRASWGEKMKIVIELNCCCRVGLIANQALCQHNSNFK